MTVMRGFLGKLSRTRVLLTTGCTPWVCSSIEGRISVAGGKEN